jgi:exosortase/archaeosortase family protein
MLRAVITKEPFGQTSSARFLPTLSGMLLCASAVIFYWYGSYTFTPLEYHILALPFFAAGLTLILFNPQTLRQAAFPIVFLLFLVPLPSSVLYSLGSSLAVIGSSVANAVMGVVGIKSTILAEYGTPTIIITRPDKTLAGFTLDTACSGIYPLMGFLIFAFLTAFIVRDKTWKKAAIFLIGLPLIYSLNIFRIVIILLIGYQYGEQLALQAFHMFGGLVLIILGTLLILITTEKVFKANIFTRQSVQPCMKCSETARKNEDYCFHCGRLLKYLKPVLRRSDAAKILTLILIVVLLLSIQAPVLALTKGPAEIIIQSPMGEQGNTEILPQVEGYNLSFAFRDKDFEESAGIDAALEYVYEPLNRTQKTVSVSVEIAQALSSLHPWENCLINIPERHGWQPTVKQLDLRDVEILENPPMTARYFAFQDRDYNQTQLVLYWYEQSALNVNGTAEQKYVQISLIAFPRTAQDVAESEDELLPFACAVATYWQPMETWTQIALTLSQNGMPLMAVTVALLVGVLIFILDEKRRDRNAKGKTYQKLSNTDQQLIESVRKTEKPTLINISLTYENITHTGVEPETLHKELEKAEEAGLISRQIFNERDEPVQVWKTRFGNLQRPH